MTPQRELRYYVSIPKMLLFLVVCCVVLFWSLQMLLAGRNVIVGLFLVGGLGLGAWIGLQALTFAIILRRPVLVIDATGITATVPLKPWKKAFAPWSDIRRIGILRRRTGNTSLGPSTSTFEVEARTVYYYEVPLSRPLPDHVYLTPEGDDVTAPFNKRLPDVDSLMPDPISPTPGRGGVNALLNLIFFWTSRKRRADLLKRIQQTFAPEITRYGVKVDEAERVV